MCCIGEYVQSVWAQEILEAERVVKKDKSPFSFPHLKIGAPVLLQGLKSGTLREEARERARGM